MARGIDGSDAGSTDGEADQKLSRRRPGRRDNVHPSLIPLLRGTASPVPDDLSAVIVDPPSTFADLEAEEDGLNPARGIIFGIALSVPIWAVLILGADRLLGVTAVEIALVVPIWAALCFAGCHLLD